MNLHEASEIHELTSDELDHVSGGFGALWNVTDGRLF
jgi:bacteriocin-like protein